jgi:hypothetical protein
LEFDQVRRGDDLFDFAEVDTFSGSRWHLDLFYCPVTRPDDFSTQRHKARPRRSIANLPDRGIPKRFGTPYELSYKYKLGAGRKRGDAQKDVAPPNQPLIT